MSNSAERMRRLRERRRTEGKCYECAADLVPGVIGLCDSCKSKIHRRAPAIVARLLGITSSPEVPEIDSYEDDDWGTRLSPTERASVKRILRLPPMPELRVERTPGASEDGYRTWNPIRGPGER